MDNLFKSLRYGWRSRRAWWFTATARTRERFARTALGSFWLGLSNLMSIAVLAIVYGAVFKVPDFKSYAVYLGIGLVIWNSLAAAVLAATSLFKSNAENIKNTNIHPIFYTLEEWSFQLQTFGQSFGLVILALTPLQPDLLWNLITVGILPLINLILFLYWLPLLISLIGAPYEDFFQLVPIALQLLFLLSPILYKKESLGSLGWTAELNPLFRVTSSLRHALIHGHLQVSQALLILLANILGSILVLVMLERRRPKLPFIV